MTETRGRRQLFVYWRLRHDDLDAAVRSLRALHHVLRRSYPGLVAQLLLRDEDGPEPTLMETYALPASAAGLDADTIVAVDAAAAQAVQAWQQGHRHREVFDLIDP